MGPTPTNCRVAYSTSNLERALAYIDLECAVFPLVPNTKRPLTENGFKDATKSTSMVQKWWNEHPTANIGIATGGPSGIVVVDVDVKNGAKGKESFESLKGMTPTLKAQTPTGGLHLYYVAPGPMQCKIGLLPGIDIKADGGYIVAPGSQIDGKFYEWVDSEAHLVMLPDIIKTLMFNVNGSHPVAANPNEPIANGERNSTLASIAGTMRRRGMGEDAILAALLAENSEKCVPSLPEAEIRKIAQSISQYAPGVSSTSKTSATYSRELEASSIPVGWAEDAYDFISGPLVEPRWVVKDIVLEGCGLQVGPPKSLKTFGNIEIALSVALGQSVFGRFEVPNPGRVLWVCEEGTRISLQSRFQKICAGRSIPFESLKGKLNISVLKGIKLDSKEWEERIERYCEENHPKLIILDPFVRLRVNPREDRVEDVQPTLSFLRKLHADYGTNILLTHHFHKSRVEEKGNVRLADLIRGSSDFGGWYDTAIFFVRPKETGPAEIHLEFRDAESITPFLLHLQSEEGSIRLLYHEGRLEDAKMEEKAEEIHKFLEEQEGGKALNTLLREKIKGHGQTREDALKFLEKHGKIRGDEDLAPDKKGHMRKQKVWILTK